MADGEYDDDFDRDEPQSKPEGAQSRPQTVQPQQQTEQPMLAEEVEGEDKVGTAKPKKKRKRRVKEDASAALQQEGTNSQERLPPV